MTTPARRPSAGAGTVPTRPARSRRCADVTRTAPHSPRRPHRGRRPGPGRETRHPGDGGRIRVLECPRRDGLEPRRRRIPVRRADPLVLVGGACVDLLGSCVSGCTLPYDSFARDADLAMWTHPDLLIVAARATAGARLPTPSRPPRSPRTSSASAPWAMGRPPPPPRSSRAQGPSSTAGSSRP